MCSRKAESREHEKANSGDSVGDAAAARACQCDPVRADIEQEGRCQVKEVGDGGPAFPVKWQNGEQQPGMTLRDWFAGQALAGILANPTVRDWEVAASEMGDPDALVQVCALMAHKQADAMLAEREKGGSK